MITPAMVVFGASLGGIIVLFGLKKIEVRREVRFFETLRIRADEGALKLKEWLRTADWYLAQVPWFLGALIRYGIHVGALLFARFARRSARWAHWLADFVSYKHRHRRTETKSRYLKEVSNAVETQ